MSDLEVLLARINKHQNEREAKLNDDHNLGQPRERGKYKWLDQGFDKGLEWVENEILSLMADVEYKAQDK